MVDYEAAIWQALKSVFPDASLKGCVFHFIQAIWKKVQEVGLQTAYNEKKETNSFIRLATVLGDYRQHLDVHLQINCEYQLDML